MRIFEGLRLYSAYELNRFLECRHCVSLDLLDLENPQERAAADEQTQILRDKGFEHEHAYLESLEHSGLGVAVIPSDGPLKRRVEQTRAAMAAGVDIVYQAALMDGAWHGFADFLKRVGRNPVRYECIDTKLGRTPAPRHLIQLAVYSDLLGELQEEAPHAMHLVLGDGREVSFRAADVFHYYRQARRRFEDYVNEPPTSCYPEPCHFCAQCDWRERCGEQLDRDDHLSLVAGISRAQILKLNSAGVATVRALAGLAAGSKIKGIGNAPLDRLREQAGLQAHKRDTGENRVEILPALPARGFARLPEPDPNDLFLDFEGDPLYPDGLEYLAGLYQRGEDNNIYTDFWAHDHDAERKSFERLIDTTVEHLRHHPGAFVYHYGHYEEAALKRLASRYGTREEEVDDLLRGRRLVDLLKVVREGIRISEPSYSLKNLEVFYMEKRAGEVRTAGESIVVYERWRRLKDDALLRQIAAYNEADCLSTLLLRNWLLDLRPAGTPWFDPAAELPDEEKVRERREAEARRAGYERALLAGVTGEERRVRELAAYLLEFHRREAKPAWWAMFDRRDRSEEELIEDPECLGGLRMDHSTPAFPVAKSTVFAYRFPPQDCKLGRGDNVLRAETLEPFGAVYALDDTDCMVRIKRSNKSGMPPEAVSIIPAGPIPTRVLRDAIARFAGSIISNDGSHRALKSLLARDLPRISGTSPGVPLVDPEGDIIEESKRIVAALDDSYIFIQGPPGSGKTFTTSHVILDRILAGKTVGVASNSHKAINNLLAAVEERARDMGVSFRGIKKSDRERPETCFGGRFVQDVAGNQDVDPSADLIAGTAWLFARPEMDRELDYLFVDEAGQVSLANLLAMGVSARNIVLVGDQMQLAQPIQGVHPGESGLSVLEYLLQGAATIAPERGIFLPRTWRMHDDVCRFISEAVYDGRLEPEAKNRNQEILFDKHAHPALASSGIRFVPVAHEGCSQKSEEEAAAVEEIYRSLLDQKFRDREGVMHPLRAENILVVAPYNLQVHHLQSVLPAGAKVGTVDKFQGQEAEVVLVSMATSSAEDLPRDIGFLYSKNRLNVAISRARSLAIVVANPRLLNIPCRTVEQMQLVNTLCWAAAVGLFSRS